MSKTRPTKAKEITRSWHLIDAEDKILGRLSTQISLLLMGKSKPYFSPHLDCGDYVVVINSSKVKVSGNKSKQKLYRRHSGYPGGFKEITFEKQMEKDPRKVVRHAVSGMLPKNKLRSRRMARLKIFKDEKHSYRDKFKKKK